ncbi:trigger factor [Patescibacteria group bacterium]|nr:trigger factor [Patescibacteria group bacterium]MBU4512906.1 trigger factor [Patescibacteria group bacterium]
MTYDIINKTNQELEVKVTVPVVELQEATKKTANKLSKEIKIDGFRPGKAPYEVVKKYVGEMKIFEETASELVAKYLNEIIIKENLDIMGQPKVDLEKLAPGNEFSFKAVFTLLPTVTLPDFSKIKIEKHEVKVNEEDINKSLEELRKTRAKEVLEKRPAQKGDKLEVDYEVYVDGKLIKGGKAEKQSVILGEGLMIPGFEDKLIGATADQDKEFELTFPKNYVPELAGKKARFKVKVRGVYKQELPHLDDDFAKSLGKNSIIDLKKQMQENLYLEVEQKENERQELEMLDKIVQAASITFIPESLVKNEQEQMLKETKFQIEHGGGKFEDYLSHLKKTEEEVKNGFEKEAEKKVKLNLLFRKLIIDNKIKVDEKRVDEEVERQAKAYASMPEMVEKMKSDNYWVYLREMMLNRKVIEWLNNTIVRD